MHRKRIGALPLVILALMVQLLNLFGHLMSGKVTKRIATCVAALLMALQFNLSALTNNVTAAIALRVTAITATATGVVIGEVSCGGSSMPAPDPAPDPEPDPEPEPEPTPEKTYYQAFKADKDGRVIDVAALYTRPGDKNKTQADPGQVIKIPHGSNVNISGQIFAKNLRTSMDDPWHRQEITNSTVGDGPMINNRQGKFTALLDGKNLANSGSTDFTWTVYCKDLPQDGTPVPVTLKAEIQDSWLGKVGLGFFKFPAPPPAKVPEPTPAPVPGDGGNGPGIEIVLGVIAIGILASFLIPICPTAEVTVYVACDVQSPPAVFAPPTVDLTVNPNSGYAPLVVDFNADARDHDEEGQSIVKFEWDYTDDGTWDKTTTVNTVNDVTYGLGNHTARVRVTDNEGQTATDTVTITVTQQPPTSIPTRIDVVPPVVTLDIFRNQTQQYRADIFDQNNVKLGSSDELGATCTWTATLGTITHMGLYTPTTVGDANIGVTCVVQGKSLTGSAISHNINSDDGGGGGGGTTWKNNPFDQNKVNQDVIPGDVTLDKSRDQDQQFIGDTWYDGQLVVSGATSRWTSTDLPAGSLSADGYVDISNLSPGTYHVTWETTFDTTPATAPFQETHTITVVE